MFESKFDICVVHIKKNSITKELANALACYKIEDKNLTCYFYEKLYYAVSFGKKTSYGYPYNNFCSVEFNAFSSFYWQFLNFLDHIAMHQSESIPVSNNTGDICPLRLWLCLKVNAFIGVFGYPVLIKYPYPDKIMEYQNIKSTTNTRKSDSNLSKCTMEQMHFRYLILSTMGRDKVICIKTKNGEFKGVVNTAGYDKKLGDYCGISHGKVTRIICYHEITDVKI